MPKLKSDHLLAMTMILRDTECISRVKRNLKVYHLDMEAVFLNRILEENVKNLKGFW